MSVLPRETHRFSFASLWPLIFAGILVFLLNTLTASRALHADEAGQWALMAEGAPHSQTADRFHGPALRLLSEASLVACSTSIQEIAVPTLRLLPLAVAISLLLVFYVLPIGLRPTDRLWAAALSVVALLPFARFIQETLLVVALIWALVFWLRADVNHSKVELTRFISGCFVGLAFACKVSAALYLGIALVCFAWFARGQTKRRGHFAFATGILFTWLIWQSSFFTDIRGCLTWWQQLGRSLGLATGLSAEPLRPDTWLPWVTSASLLLVVAGLRRLNRDHLGAWGKHALDPVLTTLVAIYSVHLLLPYKTPWLLMGVDSVSLLLLIPVFSISLFTRFKVGSLLLSLLLAAWIFVAVPLRPAFQLPARSLIKALGPARYNYSETSESVVKLADSIRAVVNNPSVRQKLLIHVDGENYWPLPYYLRGLPVGYGPSAGAEGAAIRLQEADGSEAPSPAGYRVTPFELRANEIWWALLRSDLEAGSNR